MMKMTVTKASCKVRFRKFLGGSVLKGTVYNRWDSVDTHLAIDCDAPADRIAHLLKNAKSGLLRGRADHAARSAQQHDRSEREAVRDRGCDENLTAVRQRCGAERAHALIRQRDARPHRAFFDRAVAGRVGVRPY